MSQFGNDKCDNKNVKTVISNKDDESEFEQCTSSCDETTCNKKHSKDVLVSESPVYEEQEIDFYNDEQDDVENEIYDYEQNVARASFGDMVNDYERNQLYYEAIKKSVKFLKETKNEPNVYALDIGCGTGLLSMMSIKSGADKVIACDGFKPIADCAKKIIEQNKMSEKITVLNKQSTELKLNPDEAKPNLLVAELLDTELIGEGCLYTYIDAVKRLTSTNALYVPARARIFIQLVQSDKLFNFHQIQSVFETEQNSKTILPKSTRNCFGSHILHDIQLNQLKPDIDFEILSEPQQVFEIEFNQLNSLKLMDCKRLNIPLIQKFTKPIIIFSWWEIDMDHEGKIVLSCGPFWARGFSSNKEVAWRDHWMQTIYYLPAFAFTDEKLEGFNHLEINEKSTLVLDAFHDSFCFWYDLPDHQTDPTPIDPMNESWSCICGLHSHFSRNRLYIMNDQHRLSTYWNAFTSSLSQINSSNSVTSKLNLLYLGDESIIPLQFATHESIDRIYILCKDKVVYNFFKKFMEENINLKSKLILTTSKSFRPISPINCIISELYFKNFDKLFPSLEYFKLLQKHDEVFKNNRPLFSNPNKIKIKCLLVEFKDFWRSFANVGNNVEGFDLTQYDELIQSARTLVDWNIEPQQLWEYSSISLLSEPIDLYELSLLNSCPKMEDEIEKSIQIDLKHLEMKIISYLKDEDTKWPEKVAVVVWIDQILDNQDQFVVSNGPTSGTAIRLNEEINWSTGAYQGLGFLGTNWLSTIPRETNSALKLKLHFKLSIQNKSLTFKIE